ncbi:MlaD family protein [Nocardia callitridis]|uniref:MCE family protein n=1 Tax=Nocardia callitridis TaxID=648753 RepID=A0ABP9KFF5_9NOCA
MQRVKPPARAKDGEPRKLFTTPRRWSQRVALPTESALHRRELRVGLVGALLVAAILLGVGALYVLPVGKTTYTAELSEAQSVKPGDDVRLAGVSVGSVTDLDLRPDRVLMHFTVDNDVDLGDQTSLDVRMLTIVGGHYVAVFPAGTGKLGDTPIPAERVRLPYSLTQVFADATEPLEKIDGAVLRQNMAALADGLEKGPDSLRQVVDGAQHFVDILDKQRADVSKAIAITDEYLGAVDQATGSLHELVDEVNLLETMLTDKRVEVREATRTLRVVIDRVAGLQPAWESTLKPMAQQLASALDELEDINGKLSHMLDSVHNVAQNLGGMVQPDNSMRIDQSGAILDPPDGLNPAALIDRVCVPIPGKDC